MLDQRNPPIEEILAAIAAAAAELSDSADAAVSLMALRSELSTAIANTWAVEDAAEALRTVASTSISPRPSKLGERLRSLKANDDVLRSATRV